MNLLFDLPLNSRYIEFFQKGGLVTFLVLLQFKYIFFLGTEFDKIFKDNQCPDIKIKKKINDLSKCMNLCTKDDKCTAVNYCPDKECVFRKCASPIPEPSGVPASVSGGGCKGYISAGKCNLDLL